MTSFHARVLVATGVLTLVVLPSAFSFQSQVSSSATHQTAQRSTTNLFATNQVSRKQWLSSAFGLATASVMIPGAVRAGDDDVDVPPAASVSTPTKSYSVAKCSTISKAPCVSTSNVKNLDLYLPPWTYESSAAEAMAKLKGAILAADTTCEIVKQEGNLYLKVQANRNDLFQTVDALEFAINDSDKVVTFHAFATNNENTDFGLNKKRLNEIRKKAGIFGVMGEGMNSADTVSQAARGNGPLGQLKAFYGLQSGAGFEGVVLDLDEE